jgi:hypothetical protein
MPEYRDPASPTQHFVRLIQTNYAGSCGREEESDRWITAMWPNTPIITRYVEIGTKDDIFAALHRHVVAESSKYPERKWTGLEWVGDDMAIFVLLHHISVRDGDIRLFAAEPNPAIGGYDIAHADGLRRFPLLRYVRIVGHSFKTAPFEDPSASE